MKSIFSIWGCLPSRMKDIVATVLIIVASLVAFKASAFAYSFFNRFKMRMFVQTFLEENSPVAEMATRRIKWRVTKTDDGIGKTKVVETVYVVKIGYDFSKLEAKDITVDPENKFISIKLPPIKIVSVDHTLGRQITIDKNSVIKRMMPNETGVPADDIEEFCHLVLDVEDNDLLDARNSREGLTKFIGGFLRKQYGYYCLFLMNEQDKELDEYGTDLDDKYRLRVEALFMEYLKEKGTIPHEYQSVMKKVKQERSN